MTDHELERRVRSAMEHAAPDRLDHILASCGTQKGTVISMTSNDFNRKKNRWALPLAAAAALVLVCGSAFGFQSWQTNRTVDSIVMLDVNPSISLNVNARERVLSVDALNEDAVTVLGGMDLAGADLEVAVNAIIGSMLRNGYLSELQNAILVTVENDDDVRSAQLQAQVAALVDAALSGDSLSGAVLSQTVSTSDDQLAQLASEYGVSLGKAALIQDLTAQDPTLTFASLAPLSVNEISLIAASRGLSSAAVSQTGTASEKAYIGQDAAFAAAYAHAGVTSSQAQYTKVELDSEDGIMVYEVEFYVDRVEYDYDINARTGEVVKYSREDHGPLSAGGLSGSEIGEAAATAAALAHAGVSQSAATYVTCRLEYDDGRAEHYEVKFLAGNTRYEYEIDLTTGAVIKNEQETYAAAPSASAPVDDGSYIGTAAAKSAAFTHAGISESSAFGLEVELDYENGRAVYEVEFQSGATEYEYEIDALSGAVLKSERDTDDDYFAPSSTGASSSGAASYIGEAAAKSAAFSHAGVAASSVYGLELELDHDDGRAVYELEFKAGQTEYEYEIDAYTGSVLKAEQEQDD